MRHTFIHFQGCCCYGNPIPTYVHTRWESRPPKPRVAATFAQTGGRSGFWGAQGATTHCSSTSTSSSPTCRTLETRRRRFHLSHRSSIRRVPRWTDYRREFGATGDEVYHPFSCACRDMISSICLEGAGRKPPKARRHTLLAIQITRSKEEGYTNSEPAELALFFSGTMKNQHWAGS